MTGGKSGGRPAADAAAILSVAIFAVPTEE